MNILRGHQFSFRTALFKVRIIIYVSLVTSFCGELKGQSVSFFCPDTPRLYADPQFRKISDWIEFNLNKPAPPAAREIVHILLSEEALSFSWHKYPCLDLIYHFKLAVALRDVGAYKEAEKAGLKALHLDSMGDQRGAPDILTLLASVAYESKDFEKAIYYYQLNYKIVRGSGAPFGALGALNNIGLTYLKLDSISRARELFLKAYRSYTHDSLIATSLLASLIDNLSEISLRMRDTMEAIHLLHRKDSVLHQLQLNDTLRVYDTWATLAQLYLTMKAPDKALPYLEKAESMVTSFKNFNAETGYFLESIRLEHSLAINDLNAAIRSMRKLQDWREKSRQELIQRHTIEVDVLHQYTDYNVAQERSLALVQIEKKEQEKLFQSRLILLGLFIGFLSMVSIYLYFNYRQKINQQRIKSLEISFDLNEMQLKNEQLEKELIKETLDASERELVAVSMENVRRKEWTKNLMDKIDSILEKPLEGHTEGFKNLYFQLLHQYQIQERLSHTHANQELIQNSFLHKLKTGYPSLSASEIDLCILLRLGLTGKEIAIVRNVDPESIRKAKYRLRNKMNMDSPEALQSLLNSY